MFDYLHEYIKRLEKFLDLVRFQKQNKVPYSSLKIFKRHGENQLRYHAETFLTRLEGEIPPIKAVNDWDELQQIILAVGEDLKKILIEKFGEQVFGEVRFQMYLALQDVENYIKGKYTEIEDFLHKIVEDINNYYSNRVKEALNEVYEKFNE